MEQYEVEMLFSIAIAFQSMLSRGDQKEREGTEICAECISCCVMLMTVMY